MKRNTLLGRLAWVTLLVLTATCCGIPLARAEGQSLTLRVALFPYVPDRVGFQKAVSGAWAREHPEVGLEFADWDAYAADPDPTLDVFVFDGVYLSSFVDEGYLLPIPEEKVRDKKDLLPFALEGCTFGGTLYALPQLLCADFLYTRKDDAELAGVSDIMTLYGILGDRKTTSLIPEKMKGCWSIFPIRCWSKRCCIWTS